MSNLIIPPLLSNSPPPLVGIVDEDFDDEFGDFTGAVDLSYDCATLTPPCTHQKETDSEIINSNNSDAHKSGPKHEQEDTNHTIFNEREKFYETKDEIPNDGLGYKIDEHNSCVENCELGTTPINYKSLESLTQKTNVLHTVSRNIDVKHDEHVELEEDKNERKNDIYQLSELVFSHKTTLEDLAETCLNIQKTCKSEFESFKGGCANIKHKHKNVKYKIGNGDMLFENDFHETQPNFELEHLDISGEPNHESVMDTDTKGLKESELHDDNCGGSDSISEKKQNCIDNEKLEISILPTEVKGTGDTQTKNTDTIQNITQLIVKQFHENSDDEFGEFGDYSSQPISLNYGNTSSTLQTNFFFETHDIHERALIILKDLFPLLQEDGNECQLIECVAENLVYHELKEVTETNAMCYQWRKSSTQKSLLKALNIDIRNILYGSTWNSGMPIYAANLCLTPLEPIKPETIALNKESNLGEPSQCLPIAEIPHAEFDWSSSGLVNPLDDNLSHAEMSGDLLFQNSDSKSLDIETTPSPKLFLNQFDSESVKSLQLSEFVFEEIEDVKDDDDNFNDFTSHQSKVTMDGSWSTMVPLRETYICSKHDETVVPATEFLSDLSKNNIKLSGSMVQVELVNGENIQTFDGISEINDTNIPKRDFLLESSERKEFCENLTSDYSVVPSKNVDATLQLSNMNNDDFTDFYSSVPISTNTTSENPISIEPLQPSIVNDSQNNTASISQINWPAPGVIEDDFDFGSILNVSGRKLSHKETQNKDEKEICSDFTNSSYQRSIGEDSNQSHHIKGVFENDEWSDFVSVKKPVHSWTSTPDLSLSVLNLKKIEHVRQPISGFNPNGLVSSKLGDFKSFCDTYQHNQRSVLDHVNYQQSKPNTISQTIKFSGENDLDNPLKVYNSQNYVNKRVGEIYQTVRENVGLLNSNSCSNNFVSCPSTLNEIRCSSGLSKQVDEEDWSDFVSSAPVSENSATLNEGTHVVTANIITNPGHFDFQKSSTYYKFNNSSAKESKSNIPVKHRIPTISAMPELDFISPKALPYK